MGPCQRTPKEVARALRFSGLGVRSVGPVGDFLDYLLKLLKFAVYKCRLPYFGRHFFAERVSTSILQHRQVSSALSLQNKSLCISCPTHNGLSFKTLVHLDQLNLINSIYFIFLPFSDRFLRLFASNMSHFPNHQLDFSKFHLRKCLNGTCSCEGTSPLNC